MDNHEEFVASCVMYAFYSEVEHMDRDSDSFMHWGRIGMKWGQHIFGDDTRYGRMKKAASKAADSLRGLEVYGDKMREGVARFKTQTRAEANRWRMDNGYQEDSYKKYHAEKAERERSEASARQAERERQTRNLQLNRNMWNENLTRDNMYKYLRGLSTVKVLDTLDKQTYNTMLNDVRKASNQFINRLFSAAPHGTGKSLMKSAKASAELNRKVQNKMSKYKTVLQSDPNNSILKQVMKQMSTVSAAALTTTMMFEHAVSDSGTMGYREQRRLKDEYTDTFYSGMAGSDLVKSLEDLTDYYK